MVMFEPRGAADPLLLALPDPYRTRAAARRPAARRRRPAPDSFPRWARPGSGAA
jgi:hypothetical protein